MSIVRDSAAYQAMRVRWRQLSPLKRQFVFAELQRDFDVIMCGSSEYMRDRVLLELLDIKLSKLGEKTIVILTGPEIIRCVANGEISFEGELDKLINPNSVDLTLFPVLKRLDIVDPVEGYIDPERPEETICYTDIRLPAIIFPNWLYLAATNEVCGSNRYAIRLADKSSFGRLGLATHFNAGWGDLGFGMKREQWTLELTCRRPIKLYPLMRICQASFTDTRGEFLDYQKTGKYIGEQHRGPTPYKLSPRGIYA